MSCGDHHEDNCRDVLAEVWLFLDQECDQARRARLQRHLEECSPCLEEYGIDEQLKALLHRKCGGDHAPDSFKARLRESIRKTVLEQAEITVTRTPEGQSIEVTATRLESAEE